MEIVSNIISYIFDYFFKEEEELLPIYAFAKYIEPTNDEIDELINATITEIKFDNELSHLKIRFNNLIKEENDENENQNDNDKNNGAIQERIKVLV
jgi:hypothetical protein